MQIENQKWKLMSKDQKLVEFDKEFMKMALLLEDKDIEEQVDVAIKEKELIFIQSFCKSHQYSLNSIKIQKPLKSKNFVDNVDPITYQQLKDFAGIGKLDEIKPIIEAAYFLDFVDLKEACLCAIAIDFYIGNNEEDLQRFKVQQGIGEMQPEEELQLMSEFEPVFKKLNEKLRTEMQDEEEKFKERELERLNQQQQADEQLE